MIREFVLWYVRRHPSLFMDDMRVDVVTHEQPTIRIRWLSHTIGRKVLKHYEGPDAKPKWEDVK